ncbi:DMT family transporter [Adhaeribacter aquaticus]|uniref:DMT family transporter n=1 Tax=Adhaeribacter aquaticus TaxID=299567 RepID=UPI00041B4959|nr:DMT family transporter [Adhaeribacter aquaticus]
MRQVLPGLLYAMLWASASVATKIGVQFTHPLILANTRFFIAGGLMLLYVYVLKPTNHRLPKGKEWLQLIIFSLLNTTIYLGAFVLALKEVSAGIGSLSTATNPLFIMVLSAVWLRRKMRWYEIAGIILGLTGVCLATYPLLGNSYATISGLIILLIGMLSVSAATVYYARITWHLPSISVNAWQVMLGGLFLFPFTLYASEIKDTNWSLGFWGAVFWLIIPVSVVALQLWFFLVKQDAVKASLWLFLCPIFGFIYSWFLLGEPITFYTFAGTGLVIGGLYLAQREKFTQKVKVR